MRNCEFLSHSGNTSKQTHLDTWANSAMTSLTLTSAKRLQLLLFGFLNNYGVY